jgi:hypothetical protein
MDRATLQALDEPIDPSAETVINGVPFDAHKAAQIRAQAPIDQPQEGISEEIKQRQIALAVRYVTLARGAMR